MSERLIERKKLDSQIPMAARAIGICEGCPVAQFCVVKDVAPCETIAVKEMHIDASGGYSSPVLDKPVQLSYRKELKDKDVDIVMANLQKAKETQTIQPIPVERSLASVIQPMKKIDRPKPSAPAPAVVRPKRTPEQPHESGADLIAGIFMSMISVRGIATVRAQKSV